MEAFGRQSGHIDDHFGRDLESLEHEGCLYGVFRVEEERRFRNCRIPFRPAEIVAYVEAVVAYDQFQAALGSGESEEDALGRVSTQGVQERVRNYNRWAEHNNLEQQFCFAAFLGDGLESLVCGLEPERCEFLGRRHDGSRRFLLSEILDAFPTVSGYLGTRMGGRPGYSIEGEQEVRDLLFAIVRAVFSDARMEEWTPKHAGSAKRIDIVVPGAQVLLETKYVRDSTRARKVAGEMKVDIESYHVHPQSARLLFYVWDPERHIRDREQFINDLQGQRTKGRCSFSVEVTVGP